MYDELAPLKHQVAGHPDSVKASKDGTYVVKPSLPLEIEFYEHTAPQHFPELLEKGFLPIYYGRQQHKSAAAEGSIELEQAIKIQNITYGFTQPNVIDLKLGVQLYDPYDPNMTADKQARMEAASAATTSSSDGVRLTGFSVYNARSGTHVATGKHYGKVIPSTEMSHGIRRFYPCSDEDPNVHTPHEFSPTPPQGLSKDRLMGMLAEVLERVRELSKIVSKFEWRVYGGSLLVVYEGDAASEAKTIVKMIDFAHARYLVGEGPDAGQQKGLLTVIKLFEGRLAELKAL